MACGTLVHPSPGFINSEYSAQFHLSRNLFLCFFPISFVFLKSKDIHLHNYSIIPKLGSWHQDIIWVQFCAISSHGYICVTTVVIKIHNHLIPANVFLSLPVWSHVSPYPLITAILFPNIQKMLCKWNNVVCDFLRLTLLAEYDVLQIYPSYAYNNSCPFYS